MSEIIKLEQLVAETNAELVRVIGDHSVEEITQRMSGVPIETYTTDEWIALTPYQRPAGNNRNDTLSREGVISVVVPSADIDKVHPVAIGCLWNSGKGSGMAKSTFLYTPSGKHDNDIGGQLPGCMSSYGQDDNHDPQKPAVFDYQKVR